MHTNLDVNPSGVNKMLADTLDLNNVNQINQLYTTYYKVQTFIPKENVENFKDQLNQLGLAKEGNYEYCFFESAERDSSNLLEKLTLTLVNLIV